MQFLKASLISFTLCCAIFTTAEARTVIQNITLIDGTGTPPRANQTVVIGDNGLIEAITPASEPLPQNATILYQGGKTMMPLLINTHGHVGNLRGTEVSSKNFTAQNVEHHLQQYLAYGVGAVLSLGTDKPCGFVLRDMSRRGALIGAMLFTAGRGFGVANGAPPLSMGIDQPYRPATPEEARAQVRELAAERPDAVKIWVDDMGNSSFKKMPPEIYTAIIDEAHAHGLRVAAHVYYAEDARALVNAGVDILAHSIRDTDIDDTLLAEMYLRHITYIPTLSLDEFAFAYQGQPVWLHDPFFMASLEEGVLNKIDSDSYREKTRKDPKSAREEAALQVALRNLKRIYDAGINVTMGTDSGATITRPIGFSEHYELELMVHAGLTPLQAITIATRNGATLLGMGNERGTLEVGKHADFLMLNANPAENIRYTQAISSVWRDGRQVSTNPAEEKW